MDVICTVCPRGCSLNVDINKMSVSGNACKRGETYGINEATNPKRTVCSTVRVENGKMVSVKTKDPIKKAEIFTLMQVVREKKVLPPVKIGDIIIKNVCGTDIIATDNVE